MMKTSLSFEQFCVLNDIMNCTHSFLHYHFAKDFLGNFIKFELDYLLDISLLDKRNFKRDKVDKIIKNIQDMLFKVYFETDVNSFMDNFGIEFGSNCIKSPMLDKQIFGLKIITDTLSKINRINTCSTVSLANEKHIPLQVLLSKILSFNILDLILNAHNEIIKNAGDLIKILLSNKSLTIEDVEKIWLSAQKADPDKKTILYKILQLNSSSFPYDLAKEFLQKLLKLPEDKLNTFDLEVKLLNYLFM